ncbi:restriction endonuclease subunit S [Pseudotamlana agarivorans]|uniref:restriction endonuclease subunit S n=1 Tax=Pseudotamlana agarivorans TaxID=481183 RepID=UPI00082C3F9B|nr:restriction endonuclease subunit S [Tamlana agarivorans]
MREGWKLKALSEVYDVRDGTHDSPKYIEKGYALITSKNLKDGVVTFDKVKFISEEDYNNINKRSKVNVGDILFAMIGTIGNPTVIMDEPNFAIKNVALFKLNNTQNSYFLKYYLESEYVINKMLSEAKGTTQRFVGLGYLRKFPIYIPPLQEQQQIVAILDKAFKVIDQAKANVEKNIENAKELFQSKLNAIFSQKGDGWEEKTLGELCEIKPPKRLVKKKIKESDLVSFVPMKYLEVNRMYFNSEETKTLKQAYSGYVYFEEGDVVLAKITPCFENGKLGIAKDLKNGIGFGSSEYVVYRTNSELLPEFLYFFLNRESFRIKGKSLMAGAVGHKRIQADFYENEVISYPSLQVQEVICAEITDLQDNLNILVENYNQRLTNLEELKKSILQKAFAGELTNKEYAV